MRVCVCVGQVDPEDVLALPALSVQDIRLGVKALNSGSCFRYLNVVDVDTRQLVASWLLCLTCRQPVISRVMTSLLLKTQHAFTSIIYTYSFGI